MLKAMSKSSFTRANNPPKYNKVFADLGHECTMQADEELLRRFYPGDSICAKLIRGWKRLLLVDEKICKSCTSATMHIRSHGAVKKEKSRHLMNYSVTIHPFSRLKLFWDIFMIFMNLFQFITVSLDLAFYEFQHTAPLLSSRKFIIIRCIGDLMCCGDIIFKCFCGYYDDSKKVIVLDLKHIIGHYLRTQFFLDFITSVPTHVDLFMDLKSNDNSALIIDLSQGLSALKVIRIMKTVNGVKRLSDMYNVNFYVRQSMLIIFCIVCYWFALSCALIYGYHICDDTRNIYAYSNSTFFDAFSRSLYDGALIMHTSSYGVLAPENNHEYLLTDFLWMISKFVQIILLARYLELLKARTSPQMKYSQMVQQIVEFMRHKQLPLYTQRRILTYYEYHYQKCYFREAEIYATLSGQLRQDIMMQVCRQLVENVEFFKDIPASLLVRVVTCLKSEIFLANDLIVKTNTVGNCMYFISAGTVAVYSPSGKEVCHLEDGAYFGEVALVNEDSRRIASVIAVETCQLFRLDRKDFVKAINPYPDLLEKVEKIAADRMEKTMMLNAHVVRPQTKRNSPNPASS